MLKKKWHSIHMKEKDGHKRWDQWFVMCRKPFLKKILSYRKVDTCGKKMRHVPYIFVSIIDL